MFLLLASASPSPAGNPAEGGWGGPVALAVALTAAAIIVSLLARKRGGR